MHFNRESRVVVYRTWFSPYFESLSAIGAHVAFVMGDCPLPESWEKYTRKTPSGNFTCRDAVKSQWLFLTVTVRLTRSAVVAAR